MNNTGGPAYPQNTVYMAPNGQVQQQGPQGGMTLRDYFAAKVLQGMCANLGPNDNPDDIPQFAYLMADAMLETRK